MRGRGIYRAGEKITEWQYHRRAGAIGARPQLNPILFLYHRGTVVFDLHKQRHYTWLLSDLLLRIKNSKI